jgi:hypothetical protein
MGETVRAVVSFGGYADVAATFRAMVTGEHEWDGRGYRYRVEPYGRWILGANLLPLLDADEPGKEDACWWRVRSICWRASPETTAPPATRRRTIH